MKKLLAIILVLLAVLLSGCAAQPTPPAETKPAPKRVEFSNLEEYNANIPDSPNNFVTYKNIRSLGKFEGFMSATWLEGNYEYGYQLRDNNNIGFILTIRHDYKAPPNLEQISLPSGTVSMAQIEVDTIGDNFLIIESSGFIYRYDNNGILYAISGETNGIQFYIQPLPKGISVVPVYNFLDYPTDGERTLLSLLLSTSPSDHQAAMRMMRRCLPKTWVQYALYCAVPVVILAGLATWAVLFYRKKCKALAPVCAVPDTPEAPAAPNYLDDPNFPDDPDTP